MNVNNISTEEDTKELRKLKISELENQIQNLELNFKNILGKYKLDIDTLLKKQKQIEERIQCPFNKNHFVTKKNYEKHCKRCELISKGINTKLSLPKPPSSQYFYKNSNVISLLRNDINSTDNKNVEICKEYDSNNNLPPYEIKKFEDDKHIICNLKDGSKGSYELGEKTVHERLNEYINDINLTSHIESEFGRKNKSFQSIDKIMEMVEERKAQMEKTEKTKAQLNAEQRDYKRRRKSYRAKNIRITKRSPTQIQRDIIDSFVKDYELYLEIEKEMQNKDRKKRKHRH